MTTRPWLAVFDSKYGTTTLAATATTSVRTDMSILVERVHTHVRYTRVSEPATQG